MSVNVMNTDIVSGVADALLSTRFCCARLAVGDKSFTNDMDNELAGTREVRMSAWEAATDCYQLRGPKTVAEVANHHD
jgi:hypothetical protein